MSGKDAAEKASSRVREDLAKADWWSTLQSVHGSHPRRYVMAWFSLKFRPGNYISTGRKNISIKETAAATGQLKARQLSASQAKLYLCLWPLGQLPA